MRRGRGSSQNTPQVLLTADVSSAAERATIPQFRASPIRASLSSFNVTPKTKINHSHKRKGETNVAVINITLENFEAEVIKSEKTVLVDFWAPWCGPCRMLSPVVDEIGEERTDIKVGKVNVDEQEELAMRFGIMSIPTLIVFKNGEPVKKTMGVQPKAAILGLLE
ncbi:MAG: thioredoxin [Ruminococcaceae bacterium]|nr:thioredoxin [Oscillospiraceae bacterium]